MLKFFYGMMLMLEGSAAFGCAACGFGDDDTRYAFILTTGIMTFVPLILIGGIGYVLYRRNKQNDAA